MKPISISKTTARRFVMGKQGLWPGRRWQGLEGAAQAIRACEAVQLDPLNVIARSHDIFLWSRVLDYQPEHFNELLYNQRRFFDYGGCLFAYPIEELPHWRLHMARRGQQKRWIDYANDHTDLLETVRGELRERGPLGNRDFDGTARINSYRGRKDTALALFYLWLTGEVFIHHRQRFDRVYHFREAVVPPELNYASSEQDAHAHFALKTVAFLGLARQRGWATGMSDYLQRKLEAAEANQHLQALLESGQLISVQVEGSKDAYLALGADQPLLEEVEAGRIPAAWQPLGSTTQEEVTILAPLDIVSARGRAKKLFDFEYIWEVYKPAEQRRWGYYTLPILYGDRLAARLDPKLDRSSMTLHINGFWLEDWQPADADFAAALGAGLQRFARFVRASQVDFSAVEPDGLRQVLQQLR